MTDAHIRNAHKPTARFKRIVRQASGYGMTQEQIVGLLNAARTKNSDPPITVGMVKYHYSAEFDEGRSEGVNKVARTLHQRATGEDGFGPPDINAGKFFLERRGGFVEEPKRLEVGRPGEFAALSDADLVAEVEARRARLVEVGALPAPAPEDQPLTIEGHAEPVERPEP